ncbi:MAG: hypothetical protein ABI333_06675 [bacterium]
MFLLLPSSIVNNLFLYCLIWAAKRTGMIIHSITVMGNHYHIVLTDPDGLLPFFMADLNRMVAKALHCHYGRWENFWAPDSYDRKVCVSTEDALDRMVYNMANPTSSGLVEKVDQWPGLITLPEHLDGRVLRATRPDFYFDPKGKMPKELELVLEPPPGCEDWDREELIRYLRTRIQEREAAAYEKYDGKFLGVKKILAMHHTDQPKTREPRRKPSMRIAARNKWQRIEELHRLKTFERDYADCQSRYRAGDKDVVFPAGTFWMKHFTPARVQKPPDPPLMT